MPPPAEPATGAAACLERQAFAKINLDLRILGVRPDGYHELATVFQTISLSDVIRIEARLPEAALTIDCDDSRVPVDGRNLVWQAAERLWSALGREGAPRGLSIRLTKGVPPQGGLGGGSADAAVALAALSDWWGGRLDLAGLMRLAAGLGADVPFFLAGGTARGLGRGDQLERWPDLPPMEVLLALPDFGVATAEAYAWYDEQLPPASVPGPAPGASMAWPEWFGTCRNDLEPPVTGRHPVLATIAERFRSAGARLAMLSGSGSAVFGLFDGPSSADAAEACVDDQQVVVKRARTVSRAEYERLALGRAPGVSLPPGSAIV